MDKKYYKPYIDILTVSKENICDDTWIKSSTQIEGSGDEDEF